MVAKLDIGHAEGNGIPSLPDSHSLVGFHEQEHYFRVYELLPSGEWASLRYRLHQAFRQITA